MHVRATTFSMHLLLAALQGLGHGGGPGSRIAQSATRYNVARARMGARPQGQRQQCVGRR
jgi:hypothetical protein